MSFLYAVQMMIPDYVQPIKIGYSAMPKGRLKTYASGPFPVTWLGSWPVESQLAEKTAHTKFGTYRMCGEWFFPSSHILEFVKRELQRPGAMQGDPLKFREGRESMAYTHRWNLSRLESESGPHPFDVWDETADFVSALFDRSAVSHEAMKSAWRV